MAGAEPMSKITAVHSGNFSEITSTSEFCLTYDNECYLLSTMC